MPQIIEHQAIGVKYIWTFNQNVEAGTFWDGSPYVVAASGLKLLSVNMDTAQGLLQANTVVSNIELGFLRNPGFTGELYIHGLAKNPNPHLDYTSTGSSRKDGNLHDSRSFGAFDRGWTRYVRVLQNGVYVKIPIPTNQANAYDKFNIQKFLEMRSILQGGSGLDLASGDVLLQQYSNFDINSSIGWNVSRSGGYPYQKIKSRSCVLSFGTLFVLSSHPAGGGSNYFRPPVFWPDEDKANRPMHSVSLLDATLPSGNDLVPHPIQGSIPTWERIPNLENNLRFRTFAYGFALGNGNTYSQCMPLYTASNENINASNAPSAYGAYYQAPLLTRLSLAYAQPVSAAIRKDALKCCVQFGIDAFGSIKCFGSTASGAGQKPAASRAWSIVAGYFLGIEDMRKPETIMLQDVNRSNGYLATFGDIEDENQGEGEDEDEGDSQVPPGTIYTVNWPEMPQINGRTMNASQRSIYLHGDPNSLQGKKKRLSFRTSQESITYYKILNDPDNLIFHYDYFGRSHRRTFTGSGGAFSNTSPTEQIPLPRIGDQGNAKITGEFAKIQWTNNIPSGLLGGWGNNHDGKPGTFNQSYIKVIEGPGAGEDLYRIIYSWGTIRSANSGGRSNDPNFLGYGFILNKPWKNGIPNSDSKFKMMTSVSENIGDVFYIIGPSIYVPFINDANLSPDTAYAQICESLVVRLYGWMNYIKAKTGTNADLDEDSTYAHEYSNRTVFQEPYNILTYSNGYNFLGARKWEIAVMNKWYNRPNTNAEVASTMDWSYFPEVTSWCNIPVSYDESVGSSSSSSSSSSIIVLQGDLDNDGLVGPLDLSVFLGKWGTSDEASDFNGDGVVDGADLSIFLANWGNQINN